MQVQCDLNPQDEEGGAPVVTLVVVDMGNGDMIIGARPYHGPDGALSHPDTEFAIVGIEADADGTLRVRVMDGDGAYIADPVEVKQS